MSQFNCVNCGSHNATQYSIFWNSGSTGRLNFWCGACPRKCRVRGCTSCKPDQTHYCRVCTQDDVSHHSSECRHNQPTVIQVALIPQQLSYGSPQMSYGSQQVSYRPQQMAFGPPHVVFTPPNSVLQQQLALQQPTPPPARMILGSPTPNGVAFRPMTTEDVIMSRGQFSAPGLQGVIDAQRRQDAQQYQGRWKL